jgi:hypothetical protein
MRSHVLESQAVQDDGSCLSHRHASIIVPRRRRRIVFKPRPDIGAIGTGGKRSRVSLCPDVMSR